MKSDPLFYVAAVVNVSQYVLGKGLSYILGAGDNTTDINSQLFYNRKINNNYFYFFQIFSPDSTPEVCIAIVVIASYIVIFVNRMKYTVPLNYRRVSYNNSQIANTIHSYS